MGTQRNNVHDENPRHTMSPPGPRFSPYITIVNRSFAIYYGHGQKRGPGGDMCVLDFHLECYSSGFPSWPLWVPPLSYAPSPLVLSHNTLPKYYLLLWRWENLSFHLRTVSAYGIDRRTTNTTKKRNECTNSIITLFHVKTLHYMKLWRHLFKYVPESLNSRYFHK